MIKRGKKTGHHLRHGVIKDWGKDGTKKLLSEIQRDRDKQKNERKKKMGISIKSEPTPLVVDLSK